MKNFEIVTDIIGVTRESKKVIDDCGGSECIISARLNTPNSVTSDTPPELWPLVLEGKSEALGEFEIRIRNVFTGFAGKAPNATISILKYAGFELNKFNEKRLTTERFYGERWVKSEMNK